MHASARIVYGVLCAMNAVLMIAAPRLWYDMVPGVAASGPFNPHFVRDFGCAFLVVGASFIAGAASPTRLRPAMIASAAVVVLHAAVHLGEALGGAHRAVHLGTDLVTVYAPAAISLWLALPSNRYFEATQ